MGISFGSASKKPYVGSKEVQEAYVGSQLVYRAVPPSVYAFLGTENDYMIQPWCQLSSSGSAIEKRNNVYRISINPTRGRITLTEVKLKVIKFLFASTGSTGEVGYIKFSGTSGVISTQGIRSSGSFTLKTYNIPEGTTKIEFYNSVSISATCYFDAIRYENE